VPQITDGQRSEAAAMSLRARGIVLLVIATLVRLPVAVVVARQMPEFGAHPCPTAIDLLPWFVTIWPLAMGLYGIVASRNYVHLIGCLRVVQSVNRYG